MKSRNLIISTVAIMLAAGCFSDPGEGKQKATVSAPAPAAASAEASKPAEKVSQTVPVDVSKSSVAAVGAKVTGKHDITFGKWQGSLELTDAQLTAVSVEIEMSSLAADVDKLTAHLHSPDFFDVAKFPSATFQSTQIVPEAKDGNTHRITGNMTMHGVTKEISFGAKVSATKAATTANAEFVIDRSDFGIVYPGMPDDLIKNDVALTIQLVAANRDNG